MTKKSADEVVREMDREHKRERRVEDEIHDSVMEGFVIPLIQQGLVDDVEPGPIKRRKT